MKNVSAPFKDIDTLLTLVEKYQNLLGTQYDSEEALSTIFDNERSNQIVRGTDPDLVHNTMVEEFHLWLADLLEEGVIHDEQYRRYQYVGNF